MNNNFSIMPFNGTLIVKLIKDLETQGGLIIPANANPSAQVRIGIVESIPESSCVNIGDYIVFPFYSGIPFLKNNIEYYILKEESDLLGVIVPDNGNVQ